MPERQQIARVRHDLSDSGRRRFFDIGGWSRVRISAMLMTGSWGAASLSVKGRQRAGVSAAFSPARSFSTSATSDVVLTDEDLEGLDELEIVQGSTTSTGDLMLTLTGETDP